MCLMYWNELSMLRHHHLNNVCYSAGIMVGTPGHQWEVTALLNSRKQIECRAADKWKGNSRPYQRKRKLGWTWLKANQSCDHYFKPLTFFFLVTIVNNGELLSLHGPHKYNLSSHRVFCFPDKQRNRPEHTEKLPPKFQNESISRKKKPRSHCSVYIYKHIIMHI